MRSFSFPPVAICLSPDFFALRLVSSHINIHWDMICISHVVIFNRWYNNIMFLLCSLNVGHTCYYMCHFGLPSLRKFTCCSSYIFPRQLFPFFETVVEPIFHYFMVLSIVTKVRLYFKGFQPDDQLSNTFTIFS